MNIEKINVVDECRSISCRVSTSALRIYNLIRGVGYRQLTADNALHQMIEEYHNLNEISEKASALADFIENLTDYVENKEGVK